VQNPFRKKVGGAFTPESSYINMPKLKKIEDLKKETTEEKTEESEDSDKKENEDKKEENEEEEDKVLERHFSNYKKKAKEDKKAGINVEEEKVVKEEDAKKLKEMGSETVLTPLEDYIKTAAYLGTKVITPTMRKYIYRRRLDGLAILNTNVVDKKLKDAIDFICQYKPEDFVIVCKRNAGWRAVKMFSELTGVRIFTKKYPAGIITNTTLPTFFETKMMMICDPWMDRNALHDSIKVNVPVVGICDTNNNTNNIDVVIIANNKSNKSIGLVFWLLAKECMKHWKIDKKLPSLEEFAGEKLILEEPKKKRSKKKEETQKEDEKKIEEKMRSFQRAEEGV
jgi:small subunit ribosomal protein S2